MSEFVAANKKIELISFYRSSTNTFLALFFPVALTGIIFSKELLYIWTGNIELAARGAPIMQLVLLGTTLNGLMHFPYALQLAYGKTKLPLLINLILLVVSIPLIIILTSHYGVIGGATAWAVLNALYVFIGTWLTHRSILVGLGTKWAIKDAGIPLILSIIILIIGSQLIFYANVSDGLSLFFGIILCGITIGLLLIFTKNSTNIFLQEFHAYFRARK
jgi:O-antigen/teichoic acid export membrane protein